MKTEKKQRSNILFIYPDTNIFLHYRQLSDVDLPLLLGTKSVTLVITSRVIDELDEIKWSDPKAGIRERAKESLKKIKEWTKQPNQRIRKGVSVRLSNPAKTETFSTFSLDNRSGDDSILAEIIETKKKEKNHILLTSDVGPQLRARRLKIRTFEMPNDFLLPEAPDREQREIRRLQQEIAEFKNKAPRLDLVFFENSRGATYSLPRQVEFNDGEAQKESLLKIEELKTGLPSDLKKVPDEKELSNAPHFLIDAYNQIPREEYHRFLAELTAYQRQYFEYLKRKNEVDNWFNRSLRYQFKLVNSGSAIAEDIILRIVLPETMEWAGDGKNAGKAPAAPRSPRTMLEKMGIGNLLSSPAISLPSTPYVTANNLDVNNETFRFDGKVATIELEMLHHGNGWKFPPLVATFTDPTKINNHEIGYTIQERHTAKMIEGKLLVAVS